MPAELEAQQAADEYFDAESGFWDSIYELADVYSVIHQERRRRALEWVEKLSLPAGARVLEVGCGAGWTYGVLIRSDARCGGFRKAGRNDGGLWPGHAVRSTGRAGPAGCASPSLSSAAGRPRCARGAHDRLAVSRARATGHGKCRLIISG